MTRPPVVFCEAYRSGTPAEVRSAARATYSTAAAEYELRRFRRWRTDEVRELAWTGEPDGVSGEVVLALFSRETNIRNIVGGGYFNDDDVFIVTGADRGLGQLNDHYQAAFLRTTPGCDSGTYRKQYDSALPKGRVPAGVIRQTEKVIAILAANRRQAMGAGVPEDLALMVALAGYNGGIERAIAAWRRGDDPDVVTTGGNYGADVRARATTIRRAINRMAWR